MPLTYPVHVLPECLEDVPLVLRNHSLQLLQLLYSELCGESATFVMERLSHLAHDLGGGREIMGGQTDDVTTNDNWRAC